MLCKIAIKNERIFFDTQSNPRHQHVGMLIIIETHRTKCKCTWLDKYNNYNYADVNDMS